MKTIFLIFMSKMKRGYYQMHKVKYRQKLEILLNSFQKSMLIANDMPCVYASKNLFDVWLEC